MGCDVVYFVYVLILKIMILSLSFIFSYFVSCGFRFTSTIWRDHSMWRFDFDCRPLIICRISCFYQEGCRRLFLYFSFFLFDLWAKKITCCQILNRLISHFLSISPLSQLGFSLGFLMWRDQLPVSPYCLCSPSFLVFHQ